MNFQKVQYESMDWIDLAQDGEKWWALLNAAINLRV
jgi:hypothetical protein